MTLEDLATLLDTNGLVTYSATAPTGVDCFIEHMPTDPDVAVGLFSNGGDEPDLQVYGYDRVRVQLIVRGPAADPRPTRARAETFRQFFAAIPVTTLASGSTVLHGFALDASPVTMGRDANDRYEYSVNVELEVASATAQRPLT